MRPCFSHSFIQTQCVNSVCTLTISVLFLTRLFLFLSLSLSLFLLPNSTVYTPRDKQGCSDKRAWNVNLIWRLAAISTEMTVGHAKWELNPSQL